MEFSRSEDYLKCANPSGPEALRLQGQDAKMREHMVGLGITVDRGQNPVIWGAWSRASAHRGQMEPTEEAQPSNQDGLGSIIRSNGRIEEVLLMRRRSAVPYSACCLLNDLIFKKKGPNDHGS